MLNIPFLTTPLVPRGLSSLCTFFLMASYKNKTTNPLMLSSSLSCAHTHFNMNSSVSGWYNESHHHLPTWPEWCVETLSALDYPRILCIFSLASLESDDPIRMLQQLLCSAMFFQGGLMDPLHHRAVAWVGIEWVPGLWPVSCYTLPLQLCPWVAKVLPSAELSLPFFLVLWLAHPAGGWVVMRAFV